MDIKQVRFPMRHGGTRFASDGRDWNAQVLAAGHAVISSQESANTILRMSYFDSNGVEVASEILGSGKAVYLEANYNPDSTGLSLFKNMTYRFRGLWTPRYPKRLGNVPIRYGTSNQLATSVSAVWQYEPPAGLDTQIIYAIHGCPNHTPCTPSGFNPINLIVLMPRTHSLDLGDFQFSPDKQISEYCD